MPAEPRQAVTGSRPPAWRIVLAQRTGDPMQMERARPALESLGDRQSLRQLERVAAELG